MDKKRGAQILEEEDSQGEGGEESPALINFKSEAIGYIEDELAQGYGLEQIKKELLEEGYPAEVINSAAAYVAEHNGISKKDKEKEVPKTDEHHIGRRFHLPMMAVAALILVLIALFFFLGTGEEEKKESPERIDFILYENLGITPGVDKIAGAEQVYSRDEIVEQIRAESLLTQNDKNPLLSNLKFTDAVTGVQKKATAYNIIGKGGISQRTLVEIRFQPAKDLKTLKMVESIPKSVAKSEDITLTKGGVFAEKDPILIFTFNNVKTDKVLKITYVINGKVTDFQTETFPAEEVAEIQKPQTPALCGDGSCVPGESYMTCCTDCGCPQGFICENNNCAPAEKDKCLNDKECNDGLNSTIDSCTGKPKTCQHIEITDCIAGDSYCPTGCTYENDAECPTPEQIVETATQERENATLNITGEQESPDITNITIAPEVAHIGDDILIEAKVTDANGQDDIVRVWLEVLELAQSHGETGDMNDLGIEGDKTAGDGIYTVLGTISDYYLTGAYHANIFAQDTAGNKRKQQKTFRVEGNTTSST